MTKLSKRIFIILLFYFSLILPGFALDIEYNFGDGVPQQARDSAVCAANVWESILIDDVNIKVDINFDTFINPNVIGTTGSTKFIFDYSLGYNLLANDITSNTDLYAVLTLPATSDIVFDNISLSTISATSANLQALNVDRSILENVYGGSFFDMGVTLNSDFAFDYDPSNGMDSNKIDFVGLIVHELGHGFGFFSEVDFLDYYASAYNIDPLDLYSNATPSMLDLFRFDINGDRTILPGNQSSLFGLPGFEFSTGAYLGDSSQASHWKDDYLSGNYLGVMDPTIGNGVSLGNPTFQDSVAFDVIGWDIAVVPEPGTIFLLGIGILGIIRFRKKNSKV